MVRLVVLSVPVVLAVLVAAVPGRASLYAPDEPMPFGVSPEGVAEALPFDEFKRRLIVAMNRLNRTPPTDGRVNADREALVQSVEKRKVLPNPSLLDTVSLAADLLRLRDADAALNRLKPRDDRRRPDYLVTTTLAHTYAARQEWRAAVSTQESAIVDCDMPAEVKGWSKPQRGWVAKLDADYVLPYFAHHAREAEAKVKPVFEEEDVFPLFPVPKRGQPHAPVKFVNEKGEYEPGALAAAERAKLPPDALAVAQQMMFWFSDDTRLYWLLAELYAADGEIESALQIMDECVGGRKFSGRRLLTEHRAALMAAVEKKRAEEEERRARDFPVSLRTIGIYFGVVAVFGAVAAIRALRRRRA